MEKKKRKGNRKGKRERGERGIEVSSGIEREGIEITGQRERESEKNEKKKEKKPINSLLSLVALF